MATAGGPVIRTVRVSANFGSIRESPPGVWTQLSSCPVASATVPTRAGGGVLPGAGIDVALASLEEAYRRAGFQSEMATTYTGATECLSADLWLRRLSPPEITNGAFQTVANILERWADGMPGASIDAGRAPAQPADPRNVGVHSASPPDRDAMDFALDDAARRLRRWSRVLPGEIRADELESAIDYLHEKATTPDRALPVARWLVWSMM